MIVADASLVVSWLLDEPEHSAGNAVFDRLAGEAMIVPANWPGEVANALRRACRTGRMRPAEFEPLIQRMTLFDITIAPPIAVREIASLAALAVERGVSSYDAAYLRLAADRDLPLASVDRPLRAAAAAMGIAVVPA